MKQCLYCQKRLKISNRIYCSNKCQLTKQYEDYIYNWKAGLVSGGRGIRAKNISGHIKRYLFEKYSDACSLCGWNKVNPYSNNLTLEIDHIDGDSENNREDNLRLLCPNCHSLTRNHRNLNNGHGRSWRRDKYLKV